MFKRGKICVNFNNVDALDKGATVLTNWIKFALNYGQSKPFTVLPGEFPYPILQVVRASESLANGVSNSCINCQSDSTPRVVIGRA